VGTTVARNLNLSKHQANCFLEKGFNNWKNAIAKLDDHQKCNMHQEAVMKLAALDSSVNVGAQLSTQRLADQKYHQSMFFILLTSIRFLACTQTIMHTYTHMHMHAHNACARTHVHIRTMYAHTRTYTHTIMHTCTHTHLHAHNAYARTHVHIRTHARTL
jgi:hypothetical protein